MTTLTLELPPNVESRLQHGDAERDVLGTRATEDAAEGGRSVFGGGEATLADVIAGAWEDLSVARAVACPMCSGELAPRITSIAGELIAARCTDCGTELD